MSLQLIFTDGEEAFQQWTSTDSLYGARQLAQDMQSAGGLFSVGTKTGLEAIEAFVLLDLIGSTSPWPTFYNMYHETSDLFQRLVKAGEFNIQQGVPDHFFRLSGLGGVLTPSIDFMTTSK